MTFGSHAAETSRTGWTNRHWTGGRGGILLTYGDGWHEDFDNQEAALA